MIWLSSDLRFKWFWLSIDLRFNWFGCQLIWDSNDLVANRCVLQMILVVCWFEVQVRWLSIDLRFNWFGCQLIWDSSAWFGRQSILDSNELVDLRFKWFGCQMIWGSSDLVVKQSFSARLPSKLKFWRTKLFCETSFKNDFLKLKNEAFVRDFLQKWSFEDQKRSNSARLPSKMKLWRSKTKQFCETSFKNEALKLKNEAFVRDFLQKWSFEDQKRSNSARLPSKTKLWSSKTKLLCETSFKNATLKIKSETFFETSFKNDKFTRHLTSEFQYVLTIFRHTNSCNCHAKWSHCKVTLPWHEPGRVDRHHGQHRLYREHVTHVVFCCLF